MNRFRRVFLLLLASTASFGWLQLAPAADLRTTLCDRPVCRTVAISPVPKAEPDPVTMPSLSTEMVFDGDGSSYTGHCGHGCGQCCLPRCEMWGSVDFLLGWRHSVRFPPLVTTSPQNATDPGVLPDATIVYPTEPVGEEARPGGRVAVGAWLDPCHCWGVEGRYFMLANERTTFALASDGDPILARPIFNTDPDINVEQTAVLIAFPDEFAGTVAVDTESELLGGDVLLHRALCRWGCGELYFLAGYQFARLDESLLIRDSRTSTIDDLTAVVESSDLFSTSNEYHAASIGAVMRMQRECVELEVLGKIGLGNMHQMVTIAGQTDTTVAGTPTVTEQAGLLARGANLGSFEQDEFCAAPEINVKITYAVNRCIDVSCGYTFLYFTNVAAPGEQVDTDLRVPTTTYSIRDSEYWMHAFQCGTTVRF